MEARAEMNLAGNFYLWVDNSGSLPNTEMNNEKMSLLLPASRYLPSLSSQESGIKFGKDVSPPSPGHTLATPESR